MPLMISTAEVEVEVEVEVQALTKLKLCSIALYCIRMDITETGRDETMGLSSG
jgi:hypothetical protein